VTKVAGRGRALSGWWPLRGLRNIAGRTPRALLWIAGTLTALALLVFLVSIFLEEPLRRSIERKMNERLTGYEVRIADLDLSLFGLAVTLEGVTVRQQANPAPAVADLPRLRASVQWRELLFLHLVADVLFDRPRVYVNLKQLRKEARDEVPVKDRGWQDALAAMYPLKINLLRIQDGRLTYIDEDPKRPIQVRQIQLRANNIRNIHSRDHTYPSPIHAEGILFERGWGTLDGHANFLAKPFPGIHTLFRVQEIPLDAFRPAASRANLIVKGGILSASGRLEYAPLSRVLDVADLTIRSLHLDYVHTARTAAAEERRAEKVGRAARQATDKPGLLLRLQRFELADADIGLVNRARSPDYRVFVSNAALEVTNLSNQFRRGPARARLAGKFMGSGRTVATATFRPQKKGPDFDLDLAIRGTQLKSMNDLLRAHAKVDVVGGIFSFYSEVRVKDGRIAGYVKPLFKDVDAYDPEQDKQDNIFRKIWEGLVGGIAKLLENEPREEVATRADISGPVENPDSSTWEIIVRLVQNAFFKAILPGFEKSWGRGK
jgi:uncharacterized protein DUF748